VAKIIALQTNAIIPKDPVTETDKKYFILYNISINSKGFYLMSNSTEAVARIKINNSINHTGYKNMQNWSIYE